MAVGLSAPGELLPVDGIELATAAAGIRYTGREDMVLMTIVEGATTAAVFTRNKFCAAPVTVAKQGLATESPRAILINAGNANAGTGAEGLHNAEQCCRVLAQQLNISPQQVLPFSTGVIGEQLPMAAVTKGIEELSASTSADYWLEAAKAIMTTDTVAKGISEQLMIDDQLITITGIAKGSGMICPDMATLLSFVATDAPIAQSTLKAMLKQANAASFNRITVDSDTSTNDALVLIATGRARLPKIRSMDEDSAQSFCAALQRVLTGLATAIIRDAEGATKFVKIKVFNGQSISDCAEIAYSVAHSPLVKTALFASDPNWGRLLMAIGKSRADSLDIQKVAISINGLALIKNGEPVDSYTEQAGQAVFSQAEIEIDIDLGLGDHSYHVWTSDLSHEYVSINADYRS